MYKAFKENYKIVFIDIDLYTKEENGVKNTINYIDGENFGNDEQKERFLSALLYGQGNDKNYFKTNFNIEFLHDNGIYDTIKKKEFTESLGIYYQDGVTEGVPDVNQEKKRVITYKIK